MKDNSWRYNYGHRKRENWWKPISIYKILVYCSDISLRVWTWKWHYKLSMRPLAEYFCRFCLINKINLFWEGFINTQISRDFLPLQKLIQVMKCIFSWFIRLPWTFYNSLIHIIINLKQYGIRQQKPIFKNITVFIIPV